MFGCFMIWGKKGSVEDVIDPPYFRQIQVISDM
jgi:hypothetical protein